MRRGSWVTFNWGGDTYTGQVTYVTPYSNRVAIASRGIGHETVMIDLEDIVEDDGSGGEK